MEPDFPSFYRYGGRGITVCQEWAGSFEDFYRHVGPRPSAEHSIDRIDNERGYEPGNVRWATKVEQSHNRRGLHTIEVDGKVQTITDWAREKGIHFSTISHRIARGMSERDAVMTPPRDGGRRMSRRQLPV